MGNLGCAEDSRELSYTDRRQGAEPPDIQKLALGKTPLGSRIDIVLTPVRIGFFFGDHRLTTTHLGKSEACVSLLP